MKIFKLVFTIKDCKLSFALINGYTYRHFLSILISIENFYLVEKQNKEYFVKYFCRFKIRENMWWAIPKSWCMASCAAAAVGEMADSELTLCSLSKPEKVQILWYMHRVKEIKKCSLKTIQYTIVRFQIMLTFNTWKSPMMHQLIWIYHYARCDDQIQTESCSLWQYRLWCFMFRVRH